MTRAAIAARPRVAAAIATILVACALVGTGRAQTPQPTPGAPGPAAEVAITVVDRDGKLLPFEQFRAEVHAECAPGGGPALPHLHTRSRGPATAIDLSVVADPAPAGCGFGTVAAGSPASLVVRLANVEPRAVQAWSARTGIEVTSATTAVPADALVPPPVATPAAPVTTGAGARSVRTGSTWSLLVMPLLLLAGVAAGYFLAQRGKSHDLPAHVPDRIEDYTPLDGGTLRERLTRGHAGLLAWPAEPPPPEPPAVVAEDALIEVTDAPPEAGGLSTGRRSDAERD